MTALFTSSAFLDSMVENVVGGALVAFLAGLYGLLSRRCRQWRLKQVMGADFDRDAQYHIVYGSFVLGGPQVTHPYVKTPLPATVPRQLASMTFSIDNPVSSAEMRGIAYLAQLFGKGKASTPVLTGDNEIVSRVDLSFVALGGPGSNLKTEDALNHPANSLVRIEPSGFIDPQTGQPVVQSTPTAEFDFGLILRICPTQHASRSWIVCAGHGEWGTSGASWFLANKWRQLFWHVLRNRRRNFAAVVRVRRGQDESAEVIWNA